MNTVSETSFRFNSQTAFYIGKVRDVYTIRNELLVMITTDRISAFDVILPKAIPYKGQVLNQIASDFLDETSDIVPNWKIACPDPVVMIGRRCEPIKVEVVVRGYLAGHAWREYKNGKRTLCGVALPDGLKENDRFQHPIITPTTKASKGHDQDISKDEILGLGLVGEHDYKKIEEYALALFHRGSMIAAKRGLILVDTKYEFGKVNGEICLIDEIHTPDSSRYFYLDGYQQRQENGEPQRQLSKEFVREWLIQNGFQGKEGQQVPPMTELFVNSVSERYIELFEKIAGRPFDKIDTSNISERIEKNINRFLAAYYR
ncbi:MAG TPA: phosphoribosylaminoimidazolesuccinocarboxamide synthase [Bacteroidales bacterium]|nr:phosphoribosylaminoimidazolesuccinocarboxamide synthase [Bacteroidales bacterium]